MLEYLCNCVSTHDLTKRSTSTVSRKIENHLFQLTTSRRGRPSSLSCKNDSMSFQLTTSRRGRRSAIYGICGVGSSFQLTTSRRGRRNHAFSGTLRTRFNSRPHEEVDSSTACIWVSSSCVSTHDLTKRSTISCKDG